MDTKLTLNELQSALRQLKAKKSPGSDAITNGMLTHLGNKATCKLLEIFNHSSATGILPQTCREATMIPFLNKGKDPKQAASYRPISLTSCVGKTMERVVNQRLKWYMETNDILAPVQASFRQFRATENQTTYLAQEVEDAFQERNVTRVAWIDIQRAFDKVWIDGLIVKLMRNGVANNMLKWIQSYLFNRLTTLFLVFINDLVSELPRGVKAALYADGTMVQIGTCQHSQLQIQQAIDQLTAWTEDWCTTLNKDKSSTTLFTLLPKKQASPIKIGTQTYLGVTFDKRLTWKPHTLRSEGKARKKLATMRN